MFALRGRSWGRMIANTANISASFYRLDLSKESDVAIVRDFIGNIF